MSLKIVLTDAYTMNPGDLPWDKIHKLGNVVIYAHSPEVELLDRVKSAEVIVANKTKITGAIINNCPNLKLICVSATGYNNVDIEAATASGIIVCNAADYSSTSVAQHVFASILAVYNKINQYSDSVHNGRWQSSRDFTYYDEPIEELEGKTLGVIGYGNIGKQVIKVAQGFGMEIAIMAHPTKTLSPEKGIHVWSKEEFLKKCDIISIHVPLNKATKGLVNIEFLTKMKSSSILVNTARGPIIVEQDLADCLRNKVIRAACIDVLHTEPPENSPLIGIPNCVITPHQAWASKQSRERLMGIVIANIESYKLGLVQNQVNQWA